MKKYYFALLAVILVSAISFGQHAIKDSLFSESIYKNIKSYEKATKLAYEMNDYSKGQDLFNTFVNDNLRYKYFDNFQAKNLKGAIVDINSYFEKPVILITYASWCVKPKEEIAALNDLAKKYHDNIDFVVVYWDNYNTTRQEAKKYNNKINVLYIDETENRFPSEVRNLKHALGFPLAYYLDSEDRIMDIKKKVPLFLSPDQSYTKAYASNYNNFVDGLSTLLLTGEIIKEHVVGK